MSIISGVLDKVFDAIGLDESPLGEVIKGGIECVAAGLTGDVLTGIEGLKDIANGLAGTAAKVEYPASAPGGVPEPVAQQGYATPFDPGFARAVDVLAGNFDLLDTAAGKGRKDGLIGRTDLSAALTNPDLSEQVKEACRFLLRNPAAWNRLDVAAGNKKIDGLVGRSDIEALTGKLHAAGPVFTSAASAQEPARPTPTHGRRAASPAPAGYQAPTTRPAGGGSRHGGDWDQQYANALRTLERRFDLLDTAAGIGARDGTIGRCDLESALKNPALPAELQSACSFLLENPAAWNQIDVAAGRGRVDGLIQRADLAAAASRLASQSAPPADPLPTGEYDDDYHYDYDYDTGGGPSFATNPFEGMSPEQIVESMMLGMLNQFDEQMVDTAEDLRRAQGARINARQGSADEKKANEDVNRLTLKLQDLVEKRRAMFDMLSNFSRVNNEMAKTAISNLGRA